VARAWLVGCLVAQLSSQTLAGSPDSSRPLSPAAVDFFESRIRPLLVQNCYECHSARAKDLQGGLRLDSRDAIRKGGESGPALTRGNVDGSLLIRAVRYEDHEMPPKGKLPPSAIADLAQWVRMGAPDPRDRPDSDLPQPTGSRPAARKKGQPIDFEAARNHWAYQPVRTPVLPVVKNTAWAKTEIDRFVLARLEAAGLSPSPAADRRTLIRRAYLDLIGVPPTYHEVELFVNDDSDRAFEKVVDRLLASPHYGERWGRHWLDVARYADTKDLVLVFGDDAIRPYAYTYRDYVIRAFNADVPYDRFIVDQLAADQVDAPAKTGSTREQWRLAAMGFLTLGRLFDYNLNDMYDDRIDTVGRGLLGLTVACARCHDHKYDAIAQKDYYALYGVFASSEEPAKLPLLAEPATIHGSADFEKQFAAKEREFQHHVDEQFGQITETARRRVGDYLLVAATTKPDPIEDAVFFMSLSPDQLRPQIISRWRRYLAARSHATDSVFGPWGELLRLPEAHFAELAGPIVKRLQKVPRGTSPGQLNPLVAQALSWQPIGSKADVARLYGTVFRTVYEDSQTGKPLDASRQQLLAVMIAPEGPVWFPKNTTYLYMARVERDKYHQMQLGLDRIAVNSPAAPPRAMILTDSAQLCDPRIFVRGNPAQPGEQVPRQFLRVLAGDRQRPFAHGSGRLDLARAIASRDNPLTSRVFVNRVWMHHFGEPLVQSPSDFGVRAAPPSHPDLLDYLASTFIEEGWSIKGLHRRILLSNTYQQASAERPACRQADPENRLLWHFNRQRLDMEAMRDSMLAISQRLDPQLFGRPVDIVGDPQCGRRTIYGLVDRAHLPGFFRSFDFANPDQSAERRPQTTVPQQALFAMNSPFVIEQARSLAHRREVAGKLSPVDRIESLYQTVFARRPEEAETELAEHFVEEASTHKDESTLDPWEQYAQVLLLSNEFLFVD
jgi:hypothetical protein